MAGRWCATSARDEHDIITLQLPGPRVRDGITIMAKSALPMQAPARLDQVRRLVRLDDPLTFADPRTGTTRAGLREQLDQAGRELLGSESVRYFARGEDEPARHGRAARPARSRRTRSSTTACCSIAPTPSARARCSHPAAASARARW